MNVLIVYATTEGQTRKIAEWTAMHIRESGHEAELLDSAALESDLDLETYDAFIIAASVHQEYGLDEPALQRLAKIVRGADTWRHDLTPQSGGLFAISLGLSANFPDDHEMLRHGMVIYDALYRWCRDLQSETHNWPGPQQS